MPTPIIDNAKCNGCETCVNICPMQVFTFDAEKKKPVVGKNECIGCKACEVQCPKGAIVVKESD